MANEIRNEGGAKASSSSRYIHAVIFAAIGVALYCFWAVPFRAALAYREQLQLFLTTHTYFEELTARPGGVATYIGEFLTQFFNNYMIGAAIMTCLLVLFMLLCYKLILCFAPSVRKSVSIALSILPLMSLMMYLGNPDVCLTFVTALSITLAASLLFILMTNNGNQTSRKSIIIRYAAMTAGTAALYWLAGAVTALFTLLSAAYIIRDRKTAAADKIIFTVLSLIWLAVNVYAWSFFLPYPLSYQMIGLGYNMVPDRLELGQIIVEIVCVVVPTAATLIGKLPHKITIPSIIAAEAILTVALFPKCYDRTVYQLIDYDYMVRANNWEGILRYSEKKNPDLPLSVSATNLALGMTGQLDSRAFDYFQHGTEGLIPPFVKETLSSWTTGEIFFRLGLINSAQRFFFEGMEAIPNYNKSSRAIRRLAETAIIRGDYTLARKYLEILENTVFYKKWAQRNLELIKNPEAVDNHPLYGVLRKNMVDERYLFSESELDKTLGQLFIKNPGNNLAKQYLIVYPLLQRDLNKFAQYMGVVAEQQPKYNPLLAQQALAFISMKNGQSVPSGAVPPAVEQSLRNFARAWTSKNASLIEPHRRSLFYYLLSEK